MCPEATSQTATPSRTARAASPTTWVYLRSRRSTTTPAASPQHQPGEPRRGGEQGDLAGGARERQGVQRDAGLHDAVAEVGHPGRRQVRGEPAAEGFARGDLLAHGCAPGRIEEETLQRQLCKGISANEREQPPALPGPCHRAGGAQGVGAPPADGDVRLPVRARVGHRQPARPAPGREQRADQLPPAPAGEARLRRGRPGARARSGPVVARGRVQPRRPGHAP